MLDVGTEAPDFTLKDQNGQPVTLGDFRGAKNVLVVFFPLAGLAVAAMLSGCDALVLECNHDPGMLAAGPYPGWLKTRIGGPFGHLANEAAALLLAVLDRSRLRHVVAAHLSATNNRPDLATAALARVLGCTPADIVVADQAGGFGWLGLG